FVLRGRVGAEAVATLGCIGNFVADNGHAGDLARVDLRHEFAEFLRLLARLEPGGNVPHEYPDQNQNDPEREAFQGRIQKLPPTKRVFKSITLARASAVLRPVSRALVPRVLPAHPRRRRRPSARPWPPPRAPARPPVHPPPPAALAAEPAAATAEVRPAAPMLQSSGHRAILPSIQHNDELP